MRGVYRGAVLDRATIPRPRPDLVVEDLAGELVILDPVSADVHHLDPQASIIWRLLDSSPDVGGAIDAIVEVTGADPGRVATDVTTLVEQLVGLGLLVRGAGGT